MGFGSFFSGGVRGKSYLKFTSQFCNSSFLKMEVLLLLSNLTARLLGLLIFQLTTPIYTLSLLILINIVIAYFLFILDMEFFSFLLILVRVGTLAVYFLITMRAYFTNFLGIKSKNLFTSGANSVVRWLSFSFRANFLSYFFINEKFRVLNSLKYYCLFTFSGRDALKIFLSSFTNERQLLGFLIYQNYASLTLMAMFILIRMLMGISFLFQIHTITKSKSFV
jgi:NADH:ubiquinone oxidoreductase subunit 6 (subunit J)